MYFPMIYDNRTIIGGGGARKPHGARGLNKIPRFSAEAEKSERPDTENTHAARTAADPSHDPQRSITVVSHHYYRRPT